MADRTVKVSLLLQAQGYMQGMSEVSKQTSETGSKIEKLAQQREAFNTLGVAALGFGAALGAGVAVAVSKFVEFDQQMSNVQAATHESTENMELLRQASLDAGASTVFSATEAAQAVEELSKAGLSTADILSGALAGSMDLAAAGGLSVARAAEITSTALNQFELDGSQASHIADLLAAGAGKAMGSVEDLAQGLKFVGPVANAMGVSLEETTGVMALFAQQGIIGEQAGTSLRGVLASLTSPSAQARKEIERLGITLYDSQGNFLGLQNAAGELSDAYSTMSGASRDASLGIIFGRETVTAATALYKAGADGVQEWTAAVNDSGYAAETAALRLDNLAGDWEALSGALDTAFITMGEGANGPLRGMVQGLTELVDRFNALPDWAQQSTLGIGALVAAAALAAGGFFTAVPKIAAFNDAIAVMGPGAQKAARFTTALGKAAGAFAVFYAAAAGAAAAADAFGLMGESAKSAEKTTQLLLAADYDGVFDGLNKGTDGVNDLQSALDHLLASDPGNAFNRWGSDAFAFTGLESSVGKAREQFAIIGQSLADLVNSGEGDRAAEIFDELTAAASKYGYTGEQISNLLPAYTDALAGVDNANTLAAGSTDVAANSISDLSEEAAAAQDELDELRQALEDIGRTALDMGDAQDQAQAAINSMIEAAAAEGVTLFGTNDASIALRDSLREVEESHRSSAEAMIDNGLSADEATAAYLRGRDALLDQIQGYFASREEAAAWADANLGSAAVVQQGISDLAAQVKGMPQPETLKFSADTSSVQSKLNTLWSQLNDLAGRTWNIPVATTVVGQGTVLKPPGSQAGDFFNHSVSGFAAGGFPSGIYAGTAGSIHKFAEPWLPWETYISGDPGRRKRNIGIWEQTGEKLGVWQQASSSAAPAVQVAAPSLDGLAITGTLDLDNGLTGFVDGRIVQYDNARSQTTRRGVRTV